MSLGQFSIELELPVAWGDMDAFKHVNNTVYFRWFESVRIAYFDAIGLSESMEREQVGPILAHTSCDFKLALTYPDTIRIAATVARIGSSSFTMQYQVTSSANDWKVAALGEGVVVVFDYSAGQKVVISDRLRERIVALEAEASSN